MALEGSVQKEVWLELGKTSTVWRINTGKAWLSGLGPRGVHRLKDGSVHIEAPRPIAIGLGMVNGDPVVGASDLLGFTEVEVTPAMVGQKIPVFTVIETKRTKGGKASDDQLNFIKQVVRAGGIAGIANSPEAARAVVSTWLARFGA